MSEHIYRKHNKTLLLYHLVCPVRYRRKIFEDKLLKNTLKQTCITISQCYELNFIEIGVDDDHVHFLIQTVPTILPSRMVQTIKSITARELFKSHEEIKQYLWRGKFWTSGYYLNTVGHYGNEEIISKYVKEQGKYYEKIHHNQLTLFPGLS